MTEDDEPRLSPPRRSQPYRPLRRPLPSSDLPDGEPAAPGPGGPADDQGWLALLELALDDELLPRR